MADEGFKRKLAAILIAGVEGNIRLTDHKMWEGSSAHQPLTVQPLISNNLMHFLVFHPKCPGCKLNDLWRIKRRWWMRLIPGSRHLNCGSCGETFVYIRPIKMLILILVLSFFIFAIVWVYNCVDKVLSTNHFYDTVVAFHNILWTYSRSFVMN